MAIALGIDFEHIHHTPAYRSLSDPDPIPIELSTITTSILDLFDRYGVTATFFVVSELATEHPELIQEIIAQGHEIASHTRTHQSIINHASEDQQSEIDRSKSELESVTGQPVDGFRAPTCQIDDRAYELLIESGYGYSSSVMPTIPIPGFYSNEYDFNGPVVVSNGDSKIVELPLSVNPVLRVPVSGAWIRLLGRTYSLKSVRQLLARGTDVMTYSHPWEFVSLQGTPLPFRNRVRTGPWFHKTFERLLQFDAEYCAVSELVARADSIPRYSLSAVPESM